MSRISSWFLQGVLSRLDGVEQKLDAQHAENGEHFSALTAQLQQLDEKVTKLMSVYDDILTQVSAITTLKPAIITFINGQNAKMDDLKTQIAALQGAGAPDAATLAKLTAAVDELKGDGTDIAAAIMQGTPADASGGGSTGAPAAGAASGDQSAAPAA